MLCETRAQADEAAPARVATVTPASEISLPRTRRYFYSQYSVVVFACMSRSLPRSVRLSVSLSVCLFAFVFALYALGSTFLDVKLRSCLHFTLYICVCMLCPPPTLKQGGWEGGERKKGSMWVSKCTASGIKSICALL